MIIYVTNPDGISVNDVGTTVPVTIYTSQAVYYKEANVQAGSSGSGAEGLEISNTHAWYDSSGSHSEVAMMIQNTNPTEVDFDAIRSPEPTAATTLTSPPGHSR